MLLEWMEGKDKTTERLRLRLVGLDWNASICETTNY
jgi:hypothetical protein